MDKQREIIENEINMCIKIVQCPEKKDIIRSCYKELNEEKRKHLQDVAELEYKVSKLNKDNSNLKSDIEEYKRKEALAKMLFEILYSDKCTIESVNEEDDILKYAEYDCIYMKAMDTGGRTLTIKYHKSK